MSSSCAVLLAGLVGLAALPVGAAGDAVDLFGYYSPDAAASKQFPEIDHLHLSTIEERAGALVKVPLYGFIRQKALKAEDVPIAKLSLKDKSFTFTTKAVAGASYEFAGTFAKLGNFPENRPEGEVVLTGHLTRLRDGKKEAEADVRFTYSGGD